MSFSAFLTVSVSNSLLPTNVIELIVGRSCTATTSTSPCRSSRTSRKKPVAYSALTACDARCIVDALADLDRQVAEYRARLGALRALDADVLDDERIERARGYRRKAPITSEAMRAGSARRAWRLRDRFAWERRSEQSGEVIEERQGHQRSEDGHADSLTHLEGAIR